MMVIFKGGVEYELFRASLMGRLVIDEIKNARRSHQIKYFLRWWVSDSFRDWDTSN